MKIRTLKQNQISSRLVSISVLFLLLFFTPISAFGQDKDSIAALRTESPSFFLKTLLPTGARFDGNKSIDRMLRSIIQCKHTTFTVTSDKEPICSLCLQAGKRGINLFNC